MGAGVCRGYPCFVRTITGLSEAMCTHNVSKIQTNFKNKKESEGRITYLLIQ